MSQEVAKLSEILIAAFASAFLTNYLSASFNFRRFRKEHWWQLKREAYESIIRRLAEIVFSAERYIEADTTSKTSVLPEAPPSAKELPWNLQEIVAAGAYILSEKTVRAVQCAVRQMATDQSGADYPTPLNDAERQYKAAKGALETVRAEAIRDLGVN